MAQYLGDLAALAEDPCSVLSTYIVAHNYVLSPIIGEFNTSFDICGHGMYGECINMYECLVVAAHAFNPSTWEAETSRSQ